MTKRSAEQILGYKPDNSLKFWDKVRARQLQQAMDEGAHFKTKQDAEKYVRHTARNAIGTIALLMILFLFFITTGRYDGFIDGVRVTAELCTNAIIG